MDPLGESIDSLRAEGQRANALAIGLGAGLGTLGALGVIGSIVNAVRSDVDAADDPWNGHTLEWATPTPVPAGNFVGALARVTSEAPLLDAVEAAEAGEASDEGGES